MGGMFNAPHGVICARLLPFVMEANVRALKRHASLQYLSRYDEVAQLLTGKPDARAEDGVVWIDDLCDPITRNPLPGKLQIGDDRLVLIAAGAVVGDGNNRARWLFFDLPSHGLRDQGRAAKGRAGLHK